MIDPEVLDKIKRACCPQKAIYDIANYVETDIIPPINEATNTANAAAAQANSAYNRATDALNTANGVAADVSRSLIDLNAAGDGSTVTLNAPRNTGNPATAPLPVADATKAGVMNSATYVNLQNLNTRVSSLENQTTTYVVSFTNDNPTQDEINNAYKTAYPTAPFPPIDGTTVIDSTRQLYYRWVKNGAIWLKTTGFVISQWTNGTLGTVKGSTVAGQIQAETDGTGSLVGYDQIKNDISAVEGRVNNSLIALSSKSDATGVTITGTKQAGQPSETQIPVASATQSGIVTPTMFNAWNNSTKPIINQLDISGTNTTTIYTYNGGTIDLTIFKTGQMRIDTTGGITLIGQATYIYSSQLQMEIWLKTNILSLRDTNSNYNMDFILYQNNEFKAILKIYLKGRSATQTTAVVVSYEY